MVLVFSKVVNRGISEFYLIAGYTGWITVGGLIPRGSI